VHGPRRIILPAFSPWAAGTPWNRELAAEERLWAIAPHRVFAVTDEWLRRG
jgi:metallophosphoesterase superfamily enzyme